VRPDINTSINRALLVWDTIFSRLRTDRYAIPEEIDPHTQEWGETDRQKKIETWDPSSDDSALFEALLSELAVNKDSWICHSSTRSEEFLRKCFRRYRHKTLHASIFEHSERNNDPKCQPQTFNSLQTENAVLNAALMMSSASLIGYMILVAEVSIEEDEPDGAA
jgi:hypothetical protein